MRATGCAACRTGEPHGERTAAGFLFDPIHGCALCGIEQGRHPAEVHGLGHMHDGRLARKNYISPGPDLVAAREAARYRDGYRIAGFDPVTGQPNTHLVEGKCRCGALAIATPERVEGARCGECMRKVAGGLGSSLVLVNTDVPREE